MLKSSFLRNHWENGCLSKSYQRRYGSGGAMSIYGKSYGGGMCWGQDIIPMTEKEVKVWAEAHLTADEYIELFEAEE